MQLAIIFRLCLNMTIPYDTKQALYRKELFLAAAYYNATARVGSIG